MVLAQTLVSSVVQQLLMCKDVNSSCNSLTGHPLVWEAEVFIAWQNKHLQAAAVSVRVNSGAGASHVQFLVLLTMGIFLLALQKAIKKKSTLFYFSTMMFFSKRQWIKPAMSTCGGAKCPQHLLTTKRSEHCTSYAPSVSYQYAN